MARLYTMGSIDKDIIDEMNDFLDKDDNSDMDPRIPIYSPKNDSNKEILVLSGGAIKGIAHIGVLKALEIKKILPHIKIFAGASVGTLVIGLYLLGYTSDQIYEIVKCFDLNKMKNIELSNLLASYGLDTGNRIETIVKRLIVAKSYKKDLTLKELYNITKKEFILVTTCLNTMSACYLSYKSHPDLELHKAIRMSISVPVFYTPVLHNDMYFLDGGCIDNYPIHIFKNQIDKVIGVYLIGTSSAAIKIENIESYILATIDCLMAGINYNSIKGYEKYTIMLFLSNVSSNITDYKVSLETKKYMYESGFNSTIDFLKNH